MHPDWPVRWPAEWKDPSALDLVKGTPFGCLLFSSQEGFEKVIARAREEGLTTCFPQDLPPGVDMVKGEWPGVRMAAGSGDATGGPTGAPWIDSNGWLVRLTRARLPERKIWVTADPPKSNEVVPMVRHLVAVADGAAHGARWVVSLDPGMAAGLAGKAPFAAEWKQLTKTIAFFDERRAWSDWSVHATLGVISSFAGDNEFFSHEVLNLMARTSVSYSILQKDRLQPEDLRGLRAALYADSDAPAAELRRTLLSFADSGGLLITGPAWGARPGTPAKEQTHPRYAMLQLGKGRIAMAPKAPDDPYRVAQDAQILLSHRYDVVRLFNAFVMGWYATASPDAQRELVHVVNYGGDSGDDPVTVRIAGRYRLARLWSTGAAEPQRLEMVTRNEDVEVHLPRLGPYGGIELEA